MAFGKRKDGPDVSDPDASDHDDVIATEVDVDDPEGPFDIDDFDDPSTAGLARLDLGHDWLRAVCWDNPVALFGVPD